MSISDDIEGLKDSRVDEDRYVIPHSFHRKLYRSLPYSHQLSTINQADLSNVHSLKVSIDLPDTSRTK